MGTDGALFETLTAATQRHPKHEATKVERIANIPCPERVVTLDPRARLRTVTVGSVFLVRNGW